MDHNGVWDLVELPEGCKRISCCKDFTQKDNANCKETFLPVSNKDSFKIIMTLVAHYDLELYQMDMKIAFLNGNLEEDVLWPNLKDF